MASTKGPSVTVGTPSRTRTDFACVSSASASPPIHSPVSVSSFISAPTSAATSSISLDNVSRVAGLL